MSPRAKRFCGSCRSSLRPRRGSASGRLSLPVSHVEGRWSLVSAAGESERTICFTLSGGKPFDVRSDELRTDPRADAWFVIRGSRISSAEDDSSRFFQLADNDHLQLECGRRTLTIFLGADRTSTRRPSSVFSNKSKHIARTITLRSRQAREGSHQRRRAFDRRTRTNHSGLRFQVHNRARATDRRQIPPTVLEQEEVFLYGRLLGQTRMEDDLQCLRAFVAGMKRLNDASLPEQSGARGRGIERPLVLCSRRQVRVECWSREI